jgi:hypothetical protein
VLAGLFLHEVDKPLLGFRAGMDQGETFGPVQTAAGL